MVPHASNFAQLVVKPGTFLAECAGNGVLLDLLGDRYLAFDALGTAIWKHFSAGHDVDAISAFVARDFTLDHESAQEDVVGQLRVWQECGLVRPAAPATMPVVPSARPSGAPASGRVPSTVLAGVTFSFLHARLLLSAKAWTLWNLKVAGLANTLVKLQRMVSLRQSPAAPEEDVFRMLRAFRVLRLSWSQGREDCLVRSIQLARAFRVVGISTELCIGVDRFPFRAHAWLEFGGRVLSETTPQLGRFVVIARF